MTLIGEPSTAVVPVATNLTGAQKAAILLVTLGEEASAYVVKLLTEEELKIATRSIADLRFVTPQQAQAVLEEFHQATIARNFPQRGGADYARRVLLNAFGHERTRHLVSELQLDGPIVEGPNPLRQTNPQQLAKLIEREHPQTIAIILSHLGPDQAASLLAAFDRTLRVKVIMRIATLDTVPDDLVRKVIDVVTQRVKALGEIKPGVSIGGIRSAAELLNAMDALLSGEILADVKEKKEALEESIRNSMFVFDDVLSIDTFGIKEILAKGDRKVMTVALKGASDAVRDHVLSCMSQRGGAMIREDMEAMGPVKIKDVENAQQQIISVIRALQADGAISIGGKGNDQYVL